MTVFIRIRPINAPRFNNFVKIIFSYFVTGVSEVQTALESKILLIRRAVRQHQHPQQVHQQQQEQRQQQMDHQAGQVEESVTIKKFRFAQNHHKVFI